MSDTKIGHLQWDKEKVRENRPTVEVMAHTELNQTGSCFIDMRDEHQIAEFLEDVALEPTVIVESERLSRHNDQTEKITISKSERDVLDAQILDFVAESKRLHEELDETRQARDFLVSRLKDSQHEVVGLRQMVDELVRRLSMRADHEVKG